MNRQYGASLLQLLIAMVIISIIAGVAWPFYERYRVKVNRSECIAALYQAANDLDRCLSRNGSYTGCTITSLVQQLPVVVGDPVFLSLSRRCKVRPVIAVDGASFTLTGSYTENAVDDQDEVISDEALCGDLTLNSLNVKGMTNRPKTAKATVAYCWDQ